MKRVRCPKCDNFITFDETQYTAGSKLVFQCPQCGKQFAIRIGVSKLRETQDDEDPEAQHPDQGLGRLFVVENPYHYKQVFPLHLGDNVIGRRLKNNTADCLIESGDLGIEAAHCVISVSRRKDGSVEYVLRDAPSYGGTFVDNSPLSRGERRVITPGQLINIGASTIILKAGED